MRRTWISWLVAVLGLGSTASGTTAPETSDLRERFDRFVETVHHLQLTPGAAIAVVHGDEVVYLRGVGYADVSKGREVTPQTVFYIASSTKSFTGLAASILHSRGELDLDRSLADYLPRLRLHEGLSPADITLRDLLTHTHGIDNDGPLTFRSAYSGRGDHDEMVELASHHGPAESGRNFRYGNIGYNLASLAMDEALGTGWKDVLERELFVPLGMTSTTGYVSRIDAARLAMPYLTEAFGFSPAHYGKSDVNMHAAGGLVSTAEDAARWLELHVNGGKVDGRQVVPSEALREAHRPQAKQESRNGPFTASGYGLGWSVGDYEGEKQLRHFGGFTGFHSHISFLPGPRIGVAVFANSAGSGSVFADLFARYAYDSLLGKSDLDTKYHQLVADIGERVQQQRQRIAADRARRASRPQVLPHPLTAYAGRYANPLYGEVELFVAGDLFEARMGPLWSKVEVYDGKKNALRVELTGGGQVAQFEIGDDDRAAAFSVGGLEFRRVE